MIVPACNGLLPAAACNRSVNSLVSMAGHIPAPGQILK
jgi:hypothetical protein